jgi:hypothetical protein
MKILAIISGIIIVLFLGVQIFFYISNNNIEKYPYSISKKYKDL